MSTTWRPAPASSGLAAHSSAARPRASSASRPRWWSSRGMPGADPDHEEEPVGGQDLVGPRRRARPPRRRCRARGGRASGVDGALEEVLEAVDLGSGCGRPRPRAARRCRSSARPPAPRGGGGLPAGGLGDASTSAARAAWQLLGQHGLGRSAVRLAGGSASDASPATRACRQEVVGRRAGVRSARSGRSRGRRARRWSDPPSTGVRPARCSRGDVGPVRAAPRSAPSAAGRRRVDRRRWPGPDVPGQCVAAEPAAPGRALVLGDPGRLRGRTAPGSSDSRPRVSSHRWAWRTPPTGGHLDQRVAGRRPRGRRPRWPPRTARSGRRCGGTRPRAVPRAARRSARSPCRRRSTAAPRRRAGRWRRRR